jgi:hypothetical protein
LQLEWHNHERARNAWDIERAEMKAKIAKQEGEVRSAKKLNEQLNKHIRMLEQALMNERAKAKAGAVSGDATDEKKDAKGKKGANAVKRKWTHTWGNSAIQKLTVFQSKTRDTTPSSTSNPSSSTGPKPTAMASGRSRSSISPNVSKRSPIFLRRHRSRHLSNPVFTP